MSADLGQSLRPARYARSFCQKGRPYTGRLEALFSRGVEARLHRSETRRETARGSRVSNRDWGVRRVDYGEAVLGLRAALLAARQLAVTGDNRVVIS